MKSEEYLELLDETQEEVQNYIYAMDKLTEFDTVKIESNIKTLWKHRGNSDRTISPNTIKGMLNELAIIDSVARDCGVLQIRLNRMLRSNE